MAIDTALLGNRYYVMRHGESQANVEGIVVSDPARGVEHYGLSERGRGQVAESAAGFVGQAEKPLVYCSDFRRARETAAIVHRVLALQSPVQSSALLRERYFGDLDGGSDTQYQRIWSGDREDPEHTSCAVESVNSVLARTTRLLALLEQRHQQQSVLLVAHGDVLQILQTLFEQFGPGRHRELPHLGVAEIRRLN